MSGTAEEPLVAHVYGNEPPDFAAIAACGFTVVCLDSTAPWYTVKMLEQARAVGVTPFAFPMRAVG